MPVPGAAGSGVGASVVVLTPRTRLNSTIRNSCGFVALVAFLTFLTFLTLLPFLLVLWEMLFRFADTWTHTESARCNRGLVSGAAETETEAGLEEATRAYFEAHADPCRAVMCICLYGPDELCAIPSLSWCCFFSGS